MATSAEVQGLTLIVEMVMLDKVTICKQGHLRMHGPGFGGPVVTLPSNSVPHEPIKTYLSINLN